MRPLAVLLLTCAAAHAQPLADRLNALVGAYHEAGQFDGVVLVAETTAGGDRVLYRGAFGEADRAWGVPMTPDVRFPVASVTKQVAAVVAQQLAAEGRLDLDAPVARYVPGLVPGGDSVRVRHLLDHSSGLPDLDADGGAAWACPLPDAGPDSLADAATLVRRFGAGPLRSVPGETVAYNNADYLVLEAVLEAATGEPFGALLQARILGPLGMADSGLLREDAVVGRLVEAYDGDAPAACLARWRFGAAAAMYATADDLARFDLALMRGALLPPDRLAALWASSPERGYVAQGVWSYAKPVGTERTRVVERQGVFGPLGVLNVLLPDAGRAVVVLRNAGGADLTALSYRPGLPDDLVRVLFDVPPTGPPAGD